MHGAGQMTALVAGPVIRFAAWPNDQVPRRAAGVYTIWRHEEFIYVGMSGRGAMAEDFVAGRGNEGQAKGLWTGLAHTLQDGGPETSSTSTSAIASWSQP